MSWVKNLKVSAKLFLNLAIAILSLCIVGYIGYYYLSKTTNDLENMYKDNLLPVMWLNDNRNQARAIQADILDLVLVRDPTKRQLFLKDIDERAKIFNENLTSFEKTNIEPSDKEKLGELKTVLEKYRNSRNIVIELAKQDKGKEAYEIYDNATRPLMEEFNKQLKELSQSIIKKADEKNILNKANSQKAGTLLFIIIITSIVGVLSLGWYISRLIKTNLKSVTSHLGVLAQGDFSIDVPRESLQQKDEFGLVAKSFDTMQKRIRILIGHLGHTAEQLAAAAEEMSASAEQSAQAATQVASTITEVAIGAEKQSKNVDETSIGVQQISASMAEAATSANSVANTTKQTAKAAQEGFSSVERAIAQMCNIDMKVNASAAVITKLGERSTEIGRIIDTIAGIAGQTNLLALNAAIEAARAGEQGRGFAVVAEEVRKLAEQSQEAAQQIAILIGEIQQDTGKAVIAMDEGIKEVKVGTEVVDIAGKAFKEINNMVQTVSGEVDGITITMQQVANVSNRIVAEIREIEQISKNAVGHTQTVSAATEEQSASMEEIAASSQGLNKMAEELQLSIHKFKV